MYFTILVIYFGRAETAIDGANAVSGAVNTSSKLQKARTSLANSMLQRGGSATLDADAAASLAADGVGGAGDPNSASSSSSSSSASGSVPLVSAARKAAAEAEFQARLLREQVRSSLFVGAP